MILKQNSNFCKGQSKFLKSQAKLSHKQSTQIEYSLLTGKHIKTKKQIQKDIKVKRIRSYQQISFNIRKMDQIFKGTFKKSQRCSQKQSHQHQKIICCNHANIKTRIALKDINRTREKIRDKTQKSKTGLNFNRNRLLTYNIHPSEQYFDNFSPLKLTQNRKRRMKTSYSQDQSPIHQNQNQLKHEQCPEERRNICKSSKINTKDILKLLKDDSQQYLLKNQDVIPGINFKTSIKKSSDSNYKLNRQLNQTKNSFLSQSLSNYSHMKQLIGDDPNEAIQTMFLMRSEQDLIDKPKQWHLYNCLRLNNIQLYQTNLRLSCQNWILIDYKQLKYLRGWHPKQRKEFSLSVKLYISSIILNLQQNKNFDFNKTKYRINNQLIHRKVQKQVLLDQDFSLKSNTVISVLDLLIGMFVCKNNDIAWHLIYVIGYLYKKYNFYAEIDQQINQQQDQIIHLKNQSMIKQYQNIFLLQCKQINENLQIKAVIFELRKKKYKLVDKNYRIIRGQNYDNSLFKQTNERQYLSIKATPVQIAILFLDCLSYPKFHELFVEKKLPVEANIRFQVGFSFWQNRIHTWKNDYKEFNSNNNQVMISINSQSNDYGLISYNSLLKTIVICNDCKTNLCKKDLERINQWTQSTFNRFKKCKLKQQALTRNSLKNKLDNI